MLPDLSDGRASLAIFSMVEEEELILLAQEKVMMLRRAVGMMTDFNSDDIIVLQIKSKCVKSENPKIKNQRPKIKDPELTDGQRGRRTKFRGLIP